MTITRTISRLLPALLALTLVASCSESTEPIILDEMFIVSGDAQQARPGDLVPLPLVVQVNDIDGNGVRGVRVSWTVEIGNGSVSSPLTTTNAQGQAQIRFTLGSAPGVNGVSAEVAEPGIVGLEVIFGATSIE